MFGGKKGAASGALAALAMGPAGTIAAVTAVTAALALTSGMLGAEPRRKAGTAARTLGSAVRTLDVEAFAAAGALGDDARRASRSASCTCVLPGFSWRSPSSSATA